MLKEREMISEAIQISTNVAKKTKVHLYELDTLAGETKSFKSLNKCNGYNNCK